MEQTIHGILQHYWGFKQFRQLQQPIIEAVLSGKDTLALLPTGSGKSLCYQVPAIMQEGICLVISPLIALMKDQVEQLRKRGISALAIHTGMSQREIRKTMDLALNSRIKLLYLSPERIQTRVFRDFLPELPVNMVAIDEAHCVSQWGYDFRPSYLQINTLREFLPKTPFLALTASATPLVQKDITTQLQLRDPVILKGSFAREGLSYSCFEEANKLQKIVSILAQVEGSSIIYCRSRKKTAEISRHLADRGIPAIHYHAGLPQDERHLRQKEWTSNQYRIIVSTNAFGMGIDKPDVRTVIHHDVPDCLENYYQEAGRAGRDQQKAYAVLLYQKQELAELEKQLDKKFPAPETIRDVYRHLTHFMQIPLGTAAGTQFDFDLTLFCQRFKLDRTTTINALQILQAEGYCNLTEAVFMPSRLQFLANREALELLEQKYPELDDLAKTLLRQYEGLFTYPAAINESYLGRLLKKEMPEIVSLLGQLDRMGIIRYEPRKELPQLTLMAERMLPQSVFIHTDVLQRRKALAAERLKKLQRYLSGDTCRSVFLGNYFGDETIRDCGICDNCLTRKKQALSVAPLVEQLLKTLDTERQQVNQLKLLTAANYTDDQFWKAMRFLEDNSQISVGTDGWVSRSSS
ncbi:RecQ family ATP-dependent DNA helicase [Flavihumibacter petaseus]|uniref:ATP-dependent DNA helicase RecQ n=1 Tax=Flavihumibacter petaseus NBRC 106054 TaxID=1220578 RepID=A0A0E9N5E4_9BACT|nr:ATP-dependent DNA helicase RecQ [Flavihumibacter petaseus]GAO45039.1 ATP-dependent DNA helicase RecQ [Flavihumibacter petaseus NBRC 106054]